MGVDEFGESQEFNISQFPQSAFLQDPDAILQYTLHVLNVERGEEEEILGGLLDLFDADTTPSRYIPYLADLIGFKPKATDPDEVKRSQLKQAVAWYKAKGQPVAFDIILNAIGYPGRVVELWTRVLNEDEAIIRHNGYIRTRRGDYLHKRTEDPFANLVDCKPWYDILPEDYTCDDIPEGWHPHSRIDLEVDIALETLSERHPEGFSSVQAYLLKNIEEVRPIHVLLRQIHIIFSLYDQYPMDSVDDELEGVIYGDMRDNWATTYYAECGIWHFDEPMGFFRDGGGYLWERPCIDFVSTLPESPTIGDRYVYHGRIYEWDGSDWDITTPIQGTACWLKPTANRDDWFWIFFVGGSINCHGEAIEAGWDLGLRWDAYAFEWDDGVDWDSHASWDSDDSQCLEAWDESGSWYYGTGLCESAPYSPGDVVFRDCPCAIDWDGPGPWDELEAIITMADADEYETCILHDGTIAARDASWWHNCNHPTDDQTADADQHYLIRHNGFILHRTSDYVRKPTLIPYKNSYHLATLVGEFEDRVGSITDELEIIAHPT